MSEEIVCQTCGDRGFPEALNYCIMCMETAEHTYCLEKLPKVLNEDIYWTCEICLSKTVDDYSLDNGILIVDISQCNGTSEGEDPCLRNQNKTTCSAHNNAAKTTQSTTYPSQTRPKRANTESPTYSTQTRSKTVRKTEATNTQPKVMTPPVLRKRRGRK
ncbi:hypothetical protein L6164_007158 [Bauhinia variegata]|uniref:Uncharacterized protein n=1 Tax=Bauhinia variegata TaxID=167791 RepID=A0ACB9Q255_BAUVA|nr:hypothetical protein L6164_007158 [Bauhinia variegata]